MAFLKKIGLYFIGNMASKLMSALLVPIYAFTISANDLGVYDYSQTIMQIAVPVIYVAVWEAILKYVISSKDKEEKEKIISTSIFLSFLSTILMVSFVVVFHSIEPMPFPFLVGIMMIGYTFNMILQYCSRALEKNKIYVVSGITATAVNFIGILILVVLLKKGLFGLYIAYIAGQVSGCLVSVLKLRFWSWLRLKAFDWKTAKTVLSFSVPMAVNLASGWMINGIGRIVVKNNLGNEANGLYSYANKFGSLVTMVTGVVSMALMEEFYIRMNDKGINGYFREKCNQIWTCILSTILLVLPAIGVYFTLIRETEYYVSLKYVPMCILAACVSSFATNVGGVFQIKNIMHYAFLSTLAGGTVTIIISWAAVDKMGILGVVIGQLSGAVVLMLTRYAVAHRLMDYSMEYWKTFLYLLLICVNSFLVVSVRTAAFGICLFLGSLAVVLVMNKKWLGMGWNKLRERAGTDGSQKK